MRPSVNTSSAEADSAWDSTFIGNKRQSLLLCAWFACVFMFVVIAARTFYGVGTTGDLNVAEGQLRPTPTVQADHPVTEQQENGGQIQAVSHSIFASSSAPVTSGYADAFYGRMPSVPTKSGHFSPSPATKNEAARQQATLSYSIIPDHVLNRARSNQSQQSDQTPIMIRPEDRKSSGPSWSILPGTAVKQISPANISAFSQLPSHRQQTKSPDDSTDKTGDSESADQDSDSEQPENSKSKQPEATRPRSTPLATPPPVPDYSERSSNRNQSLAGQRIERNLRTQPISSRRQPDDFLTIPMTPTDGSRVPQLFEPPIQMPDTRANPEQLNLPYLAPSNSSLQGPPSSVNSGWSDFANTPIHVKTAWWENQLAGRLFATRQPLNLSLAACLSVAQTNSPELQVLHSEWYIQQAESDRLAAAFDWNTFVEAIWNRDSTPVGSDLDGANNRLRSRTGNSSFGIRRQTETGAELEISQQFGTRSGNSVFLNPNPQATSRLQFDFQKPLLRGFGEDYNTSPQKLAAISRDTAYDRFRIGVQDYLLNVSSAYWSLVLQRGTYLQSQASLDRVQKIANEMAARIQVDVTPGMLDRAQSEVAIRKANLIQARYDVLRAQSALLRLIYGADFNQYTNHEVITSTLPLKRSVNVRPENRIQAALQQRSEVHQAIREIKAATIRYDIAANEVLPALNLVLSGYVAGLGAGDKLGRSWSNQFSEGEPGVGIGFDFEVPYRNRAAEAAAERQQITIKRVQAALQAVIADVGEDVRNQVIQRNKFADMLNDQQEAILRVRSLEKNTNIRRQGLADGNQVADLYLENLLQIQNRLEATESAYLQSQVRYSLADNALLRATAEIDSLAGDAGHNFGDPNIATPSIVPVPMAFPSTTGHSFGQ